MENVSRGLAPIAPEEQIKTDTLLGLAYPRVLAKYPERRRKDREIIEKITNELMLDNRLDVMEVAQGGARILQVEIFSHINLGLEYEVLRRFQEKQPGIEPNLQQQINAAVGILSKNTFDKFFAIGLKLCQLLQEQAKRHLGQCTILAGDKSIKECFGLLPKELEEKLREKISFQPYPSFRQYQETENFLQKIKAILGFAKLLPMRQLLDEVSFQFYRRAFVRKKQEEINPWGGLLPLALKTLIVRCLAGQYHRYNLFEKPEESPVKMVIRRNFFLTRVELHRFCEIIFLEKSALPVQTEKAITLLIDALFADVQHWSRGYEEDRELLPLQKQYSQELLNDLIQQVTEFYKQVKAIEISAGDMLKFWRRYVILFEAFGELGTEKLQAEEPPPAEKELLAMPPEELKVVLAGFKQWPEELKRVFSAKYDFCQYLSDASVELFRRGTDFLDILQLTGMLTDEEYTNNQQMQMPSTLTEVNYAALILQRVNWQNVPLWIIFDLWVYGGKWLRECLLPRIEKRSISLKEFLQVLSSQELISRFQKVDSRLFICCLAQVAETESIGEKSYLNAAKLKKRNKIVDCWYDILSAAHAQPKLCDYVFVAIPELCRLNVLNKIAEMALSVLLKNFSHGILEYLAKEAIRLTKKQ